MYQQLQMPILNKFRRTEAAQRGISNPRDAKQVQPESTTLKNGEPSTAKKQMPAKPELGKGEINARFDISERASANLY